MLVEIHIGDYSETSEILVDSLLVRYPPEDLAVLEYHIDQSPLTNRAASDRAEYNRRGSFGRVLFVNGQQVSGFRYTIGGFGASAAAYMESARYKREIMQSMEVLEDAIDRELRLIPPVSLTLSVEQDGPLLDISVEVKPVIEFYDDLLSLRIAVVEERVVVPMPSGEVREYQMVVRGMIGGARGIPVEFTPDGFQVSRQIDIRHIESQIFNYLSSQARLDEVPDDNSVYRLSKESELRRHSHIDLDRVRLVAFVQRETDRAVLQAAIFDLKP